MSEREKKEMREEEKRRDEWGGERGDMRWDEMKYSWKEDVNDDKKRREIYILIRQQEIYTLIRE